MEHNYPHSKEEKKFMQRTKSMNNSQIHRYSRSNNHLDSIFQRSKGYIYTKIYACGSWLIAVAECRTLVGIPTIKS